MRRTTPAYAACLAACFLLAPAHALDLRPDSVFVTAGGATDDVTNLGVGIAWDWNWERLRRKAEVTGHTELMVSHWRARGFGGGDQGFRQLVVLPVLRMQLRQGRSPWFLEAGIGVSWMNRLYITPDKVFSKQFNFYDMVGLGYKFGEGDRHELGLRYVHVSNADLKKPNPGEDFVLLRYAVRF